MAEDRCDVLCLDLPLAERLRETRLSLEVAHRVAGRARALSDPTRLMLAVAVRDAGELCVCDLAWISERAENLVSHHLKVLREHGVVRSRREGKMVLYSLTGTGESLIDNVLEVNKATVDG
jgi:ArsR family transcriptional regulator, lead/cadmium/zinc/bismuth-responsive transcriptional repressor